MKWGLCALIVFLAQPLLAEEEYGPADADRQMDLALESEKNHDYADAARRLYDLFRALPESDLRRDTAEFYLAQSLDSLGFTQAAAEHYVDVVTGRRSPEFVGRALAVLDHMVRDRHLDEQRLIDNVLFGNTYGELPADTSEFVEYYQGLGELRRGYADWGRRRLEELGKSNRYYGWYARYALGVERLAQGADEGAERIFKAIVDDPNAAGPVRNDARQALARTYYEEKKYDDAFAIYNQIDSALPLQDSVLLEKAWDRVASQDEKRALGMVVGLGAPVFHKLFAPELALVRAVALKRLCQFRSAHVAVLDFRKLYGQVVAKIRDRQPFAEEPVLKSAVLSREDLVPQSRWRSKLKEEKDQLGRLSGGPLRTHLLDLYLARLQQTDAAINRVVDRAYEKVAEELLKVDEQMTIIDYEIGVGLFKQRSVATQGSASRLPDRIPPGGEKVYYRFDGEYWSDELQDYSVFVGDRCVR